MPAWGLKGSREGRREAGRQTDTQRDRGKRDRDKFNPYVCHG